MRTLNISISDSEFNQFGLKKDTFAFSELVNLLSGELTRQALSKSVELAQKYHLSDMSMDDISSEVNAVRKNAKGNS